MQDFHYISYSQEVIFGGAALVRMAQALDHIGLHRLLLCTDDGNRVNGHAARVREALGDRLAVTFDQVSPTVQESLLDDLIALAQANDVDGVVGLGGTPSCITMAKAVAFSVEQQLTQQLGHAPPPWEQPLLPVVAIPHSYAGLEMTSEFTVIRASPQPGRAVTTYDPRIAPRLVVYAPELTLDLTPQQTAASGMHALAHCFEALYSITRHPVSTAAAWSGLRMISDSLASCYWEAGNLQARTTMLAGAHLAGFASATVAMGLHHGLCRVLDAAGEIPPGLCDGIILPQAIRFNAGAPSFDWLPVAEALGVSVNGHGSGTVIDAIARRVSDLCNELGLPHRLRDLGVKQEQLRHLAELSYEDLTVQNNPRRITDPGQIETLLGEAW